MELHGVVVCMCQWKLLSGISGGEKYSASIKQFVFLQPFVSKMIWRWIKLNLTLITLENTISSHDSRTLASSQPFQDSVHSRSLNLNHNPVQTLQGCKDLHCSNFYLASFLPSHLYLLLQTRKLRFCFI